MLGESLMTDRLGLAGESAENLAPVARLIARARSGDTAAFDQIIINHQHKIILLAWRMLGNQDDALDAAQETFLRVYKHLHKFDLTQDFSGWLYRIAVNVCRDIGRKRRGNHISFEAGIAAGTLSEPISPHNTETFVQLSQQQALVMRALATLSRKERAAIVLRDIEGFSTEEVARVLGSSATTVRSQICSARVKLKAFRDRMLKS